jgi:hypothetical protein
MTDDTEEVERLSEAVVNCHRAIYARDALVKNLLDLLRDAGYFVPSGLLRDRIDEALNTHLK